MHVTAAIPHIRDIINSGHNVRMVIRITSFTVTKVSEAKVQIYIFCNNVSNTVNVGLRQIETEREQAGERERDRNRENQS